MGKSKIEWTDVVWNPVTGCTKVSAGCKHCYAERMVERLGRVIHPWEDPIPGGRARPFSSVRTWPDRLDQPLHWRKPRKVFVCSMSDLFHEDVPDGFIMRCLNVMAQTSHTYQLLTKRPERMRSFFTRWADVTGEDFDPKLVRGPDATRKAHPSPRGQLFASMLESMGCPPPGCTYPTFDWMDGMIGWPKWFANIWIGVSVDDQATADERIPLLLQTPAAVRFVSVEPMLGPVSFRWAKWHNYYRDGWRERGEIQGQYDGMRRLDWIICGGESGPQARPMELAWARKLRDQCHESGVPFFFKQWGEWCPPSQMPPDIFSAWEAYHGTENGTLRYRPWRIGKHRAGALLDGREWKEWPNAHH